MKRINAIALLLWLVVSCAPTRPATTVTKQITLDFKNCRVMGELEKLRLTLPDGFELITLEPEEGFCEYQLLYPDQSIYYVSTNIYSGSRINYKNRYEAGISTYSVNRSINDTLNVRGVQQDGRYWHESIRGSYVVGYANLSDTTQFENVCIEIPGVSEPKC